MLCVIIEYFPKYEIFDKSKIQLQFISHNPHPDIFKEMGVDSYEFLEKNGTDIECLTNKNIHGVNYIMQNGLSEAALRLGSMSDTLAQFVYNTDYANLIEATRHVWSDNCIAHLQSTKAINFIFRIPDESPYSSVLHTEAAFPSSLDKNYNFSSNPHDTAVKFLLAHPKFINWDGFMRNENDLAVEHCNQMDYKQFINHRAQNSNDLCVRVFLKNITMERWRDDETLRYYASCNKSKIMYRFIVDNNLICWSGMSSNPNVLTLLEMPI